MSSIISATVLLTEGMTPRLFDLDFQLLHDSVLSLIAVLALFFFMSYFLFNPVREMLRKRQEKIRDELDQAAADQQDAAQLKTQYEEKLKNIEKEAEEILGEARRKALANEKRIEDEAKEEAARILERARTEAELEKKKAADDVKREMIAIASLMAGKVVAASIDTAVQDRLVEETLKEIGDRTWLS